MDIGNLIIVVASGAGLISTGGALVGGIIWRMRKLGSAERDQIATHAAKSAVGALNVALDRYVQDLKDALARVEDLETKLSEADNKITHLEGQLHAAHGDRDRLERELRASMSARQRLEDELARQHLKIIELENKLDAATDSR